MTTSVEELRIQTPSLSLSARAWGAQDGIPVLAIHGWLDNAASFDRLAPLLPELRLICLDLPGHGLSDHEPVGRTYLFIDTVAHVYAAVEALGWTRFALIGHSLGAAVAAVLAGTIPDRVQRLVLLEGLGPLTEAAKHAPERLANALRDERIRTGRRMFVYDSVEHAVERMMTTASRLSRRSAQILATRGLVEVPGGYTWRSDPRLRLPSRLRLSEEQVLAFLRAVDCPVFAMRATEGFSFAKHLMQARIEALGDVTAVERPGRHHLHLDDPEQFIAPLRAFFGLPSMP